jgi:transcriptional regulator with XRE-family HTH domain
MGRQQSTHIDDPIKVGQRLHRARQEASLTVRQLAFPGCSATYISHLEKGRRTPSLQVLVELGRRLNVRPTYLAWGKGQAKPCPGGAARPRSGFGLATFEQALAAARNDSERIWALTGLAQAAITEGDQDKAEAALQQALTMVKALQPVGDLRTARLS